MKFDKIHNKGQARLFKNQYIEYLTKTHPLVIWGIYLPVIVFMFYYSYLVLNLELTHVLFIFFSGMFFWTFSEYMLHRFAFHFIAENERAMKIVYIIHGNHHEYRGSVRYRYSRRPSTQSSDGSRHPQFCHGLN